VSEAELMPINQTKLSQTIWLKRSTGKSFRNEKMEMIN